MKKKSILINNFKQKIKRDSYGWQETIKTIKFKELSQYLLYDIVKTKQKKSFTYINISGDSYFFAAQKKDNIHTAYYLLFDDKLNNDFILNSKVLNELGLNNLERYDKNVIYGSANWINEEKKEKYKIKFLQMWYDLPFVSKQKETKIYII